MTLHSAKGLEFPVVVLAGPRRRAVPALAVARGRGGARGGAAALLRRHDARARAAGADRRGAAPRLRRVPVERAVALHRRGPGGAGRAHRAVVLVVGRTRATSRTTSSAPTRTAAAAGGRVTRRARRPTRTRTRISRPGMALRRACASGTRSSASGTVISVEALDDDTKLVVRFTGRAEDAAREVRGLEPA